MKIGIIGTGAISKAYVKGAEHYKDTDLVACADLDMARATAAAESWGVRALSVPDLLKDPEIELVLNLTVPQAHVEVALACLNAGKHTYAEKPFALDRKDGQRILDLAKTKKLRSGCAPDTVLGAGIQTSRRIVDAGTLGRVTSGVAFMLSGGVETWHPNPFFYYQKGGGPLFDMGPYYLTALVTLLGPVARVSSMVSRAHDERIATCKEHPGAKIEVEIDTHVAAVLEFKSGAIVTLIMSFDVPGNHHLPRIELYGTEGSLGVPDPNGFGGPVQLRKRGEEEWSEVPLDHEQGTRGAGPADMARAIQSGRPHRASGDLAQHVLDVMQAIIEAGNQKKSLDLASSCERPAAIPAGLAEGTFD